MANITAIKDMPATGMVDVLITETNSRAVQHTALLADVAALRVTVNAIITAATTSLPAVAAVTPAPAATGTAPNTIVLRS